MRRLLLLTALCAAFLIGTGCSSSTTSASTSTPSDPNKGTGQMGVPPMGQMGVPPKGAPMPQ